MPVQPALPFAQTASGPDSKPNVVVLLTPGAEGFGMFPSATQFVGFTIPAKVVWQVFRTAFWFPCVTKLLRLSLLQRPERSVV